MITHIKVGVFLWLTFSAPLLLCNSAPSGEDVHSPPVEHALFQSIYNLPKGLATPFIYQELSVNDEIKRFSIIDLKNMIITYQIDDMIFSYNSEGNGIVRTLKSKVWTKVSGTNQKTIERDVNAILNTMSVFGELSNDLGEFNRHIQKIAMEGNVAALPAMITQQELLKKIISGQPGHWKGYDYDIGSDGIITNRAITLNTNKGPYKLRTTNRFVSEDDVRVIQPYAIEVAQSDFSSLGRSIPRLFYNGGYAWDLIVEDIPANIDGSRLLRGFRVQERDGIFYVYSVIRNSSAAKAGIHSGLTLVRIGNTDVNGMTIGQIIALLASSDVTEFTFSDGSKEFIREIPLSSAK